MHRGHHGSSARSRHRPSSSGPASSRPPTLVARSVSPTSPWPPPGVVRPASAAEIADAAPGGTGRTLILPGHWHSSFATAPERFAREVDAFARDVGL